MPFRYYSDIGLSFRNGAAVDGKWVNVWDNMMNVDYGLLWEAVTPT